MSVKNFEELYVEELRDLYSAERQLVSALPKIAKAATSPQLKKAVEMHLEQTKGQVERLEQIFKDLDEKPTGKHCKAMEGLIEEGKEMIEEIEKGPLLDAGLIGGSQKIEHYEIAGYGTACAFAQEVNRTADLKLLQATLKEETSTDEALTQLATGSINKEASRQEEPAKARK